MLIAVVDSFKTFFSHLEDGLFKMGKGVFDGTIVEGAGSIMMPAAVEILAGELVDIHLSFRAERDPDSAVSFGEKGGVVYGTERQTIIDEAFGVADFVVMLHQVVVGEVHIGCALLGHNNQALRKSESEQTDAAFGVVVIYFPVDGLAVDAGGDELLQHLVGAGVVAGVGHRPRVGDDTHVQRLSDRAGEGAPGGEVSVKEIVNQFAGGTGLGGGIHHLTVDGGLHVMVNQNLEGVRLNDAFFKVCACAVWGVHIDDEEHFGLHQCFDGLLGVLLGDDNLVASGHPIQEAGEDIRRYHSDFKTVVGEVVIKRQCTA